MQRRWSWFVVQAHRGEVHLAAQNVGKLDIKTYLPLVKNETGKRIVPLFDEYFFARWCPSWARTRHVRGVASLIFGAGGELGYVANAFVRGLQALENKRGIIDFDNAPPPFVLNDGDEVRAKSGTFVGQMGRVKGLQDGHYVSVLFSIIGREVSVVHRVSELEQVVEETA